MCSEPLDGFLLHWAPNVTGGKKALTPFVPTEDRTRISCVAVRHSTASLLKVCIIPNITLYTLCKGDNMEHDHQKRKIYLIKIKVIAFIINNEKNTLEIVRCESNMGASVSKLLALFKSFIY